MILLSLSVICFLLGQVGRLSFNQQEINLYLYELPYFAWVAYQLFIKRYIYRLRKETTTLVGILLVTFLLGIARVQAFPNFVSFLYLVRLVGYLLGFDIITDCVKNGFISKKLVQISIFLLGFFGMIQYFLYGNLRNLQYLGWDPHQSRVFGQFFDTSVAGAVYGLILVYMLFRRNLFMSKIVKWIYVICYALLGLFTYSRGYLLSIVSAAGVQTLIIKNNIKLLGIVVLIILGFIVLAPKPFGEGVKLFRTSTIESRLVDYRVGLNLFLKNPLIGVGYNRIRYFKPPDTSLIRGLSHAGASFHSSYLIVAVTSGVVGLGAFLYWFWLTGRMSDFALVSGVFISVYSLFDNIILHPFVLFLWPILIGLTSRKKR
jgi:O-antigen ligase